MTLCASGFMDDLMFSHNEVNGPEAKTTRMFRPVRQMAAPDASVPSLTASHYCSVSYL